MNTIYPPTRPAQPPQRRRYNKGKIALVLLTCCLLLLAGAYLLVYLTHSARTQAGQDKTTQLQPLATQPPLTLHDPVQLYTAALQRRPLLSDPLTQQSNYQWSSANTNGSCRFDHRSLHIISNQRNQLAICLTQAQTFTNIAFQATLNTYQGSFSGLVIHADTTGQSLYLFGITPAKRYMLAVAHPDQLQEAQVLAGGISTAIKDTQQQNTLTVIAQKTTLYLYINGHYLTKVNTPTTSAGYSGLFVGDHSNDTADAYFSNVKVWSI
jgi:hypothetical protein